MNATNGQTNRLLRLLPRKARWIYKLTIVGRWEVFNYEGALVPLKLAELLFLGRRGQWQHRRLLQLPCVAKPWEEKRGKKNKDTVKGFLVRKTLHLSPLLILVLSKNEPALPYVNASANIPLCTIFADWLWKEHLQYIIFMEEGRFNFCGHHRGVNKTWCTGAFFPHTPLSGCSVPTSPGWWKLLNCGNKKQTIHPAHQEAESLWAGTKHWEIFKTNTKYK